MSHIRYYVIGAFALIACLACYYVIARKQYFERADRYKELRYLMYYVEEQHNKSEGLLVEIKKAIDRKGTIKQDESIIKEAEKLKQQVSSVYYTLAKVGKNLPDYTRCNVLADESAVVTALQDFESYIKKQHATFLPTLQNINDKDYLSTQSIEEARFVAVELQSRLLACEQAILDSYLAKIGAQKPNANVVPVVQSDKQTYYEGETYQAKLLLFSPIRFEKGTAKATFNGQPIALDDNSVAHISFPVGKAGEYSWQGSFSCSYRGLDTTFHIQQKYKVFSK